jgi:predicted DNA-binding protein YlxM (UPF0122 family)
MNTTSTIAQRDLRVFRDYFNNYLTVGCMAEHYGVTESEMHDMVSRGRTIHNHIAKTLKGA